jgi:hypothetical protein
MLGGWQAIVVGIIGTDIMDCIIAGRVVSDASASCVGENNVRTIANGPTVHISARLRLHLCFIA